MENKGMTNHQPDARTLAREVADRARELGCELSDQDDPSVAELIIECARRRVSREAVLAGVV